MGEIVEFPYNGSTGRGYLAAPGAGAGPGVVVIQEWWGLVPHIKDVCERLAAEGFTALAPDLYHGETTTEPDEAGKMMMALDMERAAKEMATAAAFLQGHERTRGQGVGTIGFCMGGGLSLYLATLSPHVKAASVFYGAIPWEQVKPDLSRIQCAVQLHYAENDGWASPSVGEETRDRLRELGVEAELFVYPNADHAFFNDTRPEVYDEGAARQAWVRTLELFRAKLG
jgi:carboxymethylenebutenolidase